MPVADPMTTATSIASPIPTDAQARWSVVLDSMEQHVDQITAALHGSGNFPGEFATVMPEVPLPPALAARAQLLVARQRDVEAELRRRAGVLGAFIFGDRRPELQTGVSVDVRS